MDMAPEINSMEARITKPIIIFDRMPITLKLSTTNV